MTSVDEAFVPAKGSVFIITLNGWSSHGGNDHPVVVPILEHGFFASVSAAEVQADHLNHGVRMDYQNYADETDAAFTGATNDYATHARQNEALLAADLPLLPPRQLPKPPRVLSFHDWVRAETAITYGLMPLEPARAV